MPKYFALTTALALVAALCGVSSSPTSPHTTLFPAVTLAEGRRAPRTGADWVGRKIYQIMTDRFATDKPNPCGLGGGSSASCHMDKYLGGNYKGAMQQLDYIKGMGFDAIWISPIVTNLENWRGIEGYHGYWATNFFDVNPHFGTRQDLIDFVKACHARDIWVMVDIVINHVGPIGTDYSQISLFDRPEHYHQPCHVNNYQCFSDEIYNCRLADLPDLDQSNPWVQEKLRESLKWLIDTFDFDGMRADTVMYVPVDSWRDCFNYINQTFITGEVWADFHCNQQYITQGGISSTLNYPVYQALRNGFLYGQSLRQLGGAWREQAQLPNPNWQVNFIDNHDNDRFLSVGGANMNNYMSSIAYIYFTNGIPAIYYGTEQQMKGLIGDNTCREPLWITNYSRENNLYGWMADLNRFYTSLNVTHGSPTAIVEERWQDDHFYCAIRGAARAMLCITNTPTVAQTRTIPNLQMFENRRVCVLGHKDVTYDGASTMTITVAAGQSPWIMYAC